MLNHPTSFTCFTFFNPGYTTSKLNITKQETAQGVLPKPHSKIILSITTHSNFLANHNNRLAACINSSPPHPQSPYALTRGHVSDFTLGEVQNRIRGADNVLFQKTSAIHWVPKCSWVVFQIFTLTFFSLGCPQPSLSLFFLYPWSLFPPKKRKKKEENFKPFSKLV